MSSSKTKRVAIWASVVLAVTAAAPAWAVVRHPDAFEASNGDPAGPAQWYARWDGNATAMAIGPQYVLTTRHQRGGVGSVVTFDSGPNAGASYVATEETVIGGANNDLRVVKLDRPLATWASLYTGSTAGQTVLIGGFGPQRGPTNYVDSNNRLRGYSLTAAGNASSLLFGQNRIEGSSVVSSGEYAGTPLIVSDFDGPENPVGYNGVSPTPTNKVAYEAFIGDGDSGSGWFINDNGTLRLVGLSDVAELSQVNNGTITPYDPSQPGVPAVFFGAAMGAVDLTGFASQINAIVPEPSMLAVALLPLAMLKRRRRSGR